MEAFEILFRLDRVAELDVGVDAIESLLAALEKNGQIVGDTPTARRGNSYRVFVNVPRADALEPRSGNRWVRRAEKRLTEVGVRPAKIRRLGHEPESRGPCACKRRPFFVLFTNYRSDESPVRCGECCGPVPLYTLPATGEAGDYLDLLNWQSTYQALDELFIGSGVAEHYSHRQMSTFASALTIEGREVATRLEAKVKRPVYYYLMKYFGSSRASELRRKCPCCKKAWALSTPIHQIFDFRCDRCRLVSNVAFDVRRAE